jgi:hypothetical protein
VNQPSDSQALSFTQRQLFLPVDLSVQHAVTVDEILQIHLLEDHGELFFRELL